MSNYRKMVEEFIGRKLSRYEVIHHINGWHHDNSLENLYIFTGTRPHLRFHNVVNDGTVSLEVLKSNLQEVKKHGTVLRKDDASKRCELARRGEKRLEILRDLRAKGLEDELGVEKFYELVVAKLAKACDDAIEERKDKIKHETKIKQIERNEKKQKLIADTDARTKVIFTEMFAKLINKD